MVVLHLARWLNHTGLARPVIGLRQGGPLLEEFEKVGPVLKLWKGETTAEDLDGVQLVYANTGCHGSLAALFRESGIPLISHIHEMEHELRLRSPAELDRQLKASDHFIACSQAVADCLIDEFRVAKDRVSVIHEPIDIVSLEERLTFEDVGNLGASLGFPEGSRIFLGAGTASWRKGSDVFLSVASEVCRHDSQARGLWVGKVPPDELIRLSHDLRRLGLEGKVVFAGEQANPFPLMALARVFCLTSREDPYPLVMIEAAYLGLHVIGFKNAGGVSEFVRDAGGETVPYLDSRAMAEAVLRHWGRFPEKSTNDGDVTAWVREHLDVAVVGQQILALVASLALPDPLPNNLASRRELAARVAALALPQVAVRVEAALDGDYLPAPLWEGHLSCGLETELSLPIPSPPSAAAGRVRWRVTFGEAPLSLEFAGDGLVQLRPGTEGISLPPRHSGGRRIVFLRAPARAYFDLEGQALADAFREGALRLSLCLDREACGEIASHFEGGGTVKRSASLFPRLANWWSSSLSDLKRGAG